MTRQPILREQEGNLSEFARSGAAWLPRGSSGVLGPSGMPPFIIGAVERDR